MDVQRTHQRVVAFETPAAAVNGGPLHARTAAGKLIMVVTNEATQTLNRTYTATVGFKRIPAVNMK